MKKKLKLIAIKIYDTLFLAKIFNFAIDRYMERNILHKYLLYGNEDRLQIDKTAVVKMLHLTQFLASLK